MAEDFPSMPKALGSTPVIQMTVVVMMMMEMMMEMRTIVVIDETQLLLSMCETLGLISNTTTTSLNGRTRNAISHNYTEQNNKTAREMIA